MSNREPYRYIIVGAGSAGCLLARRLAAQQSHPVAVIEAGSAGAAQDVRSVVPNYYPHTFGSSLDWNFATVPQAALRGRRVAWPRGKLLGGSGAINALIYMQPADADWARWGWPSSRNQKQADSTGDAYETSVPSTSSMELSVSALASPHPWTRAFLQSATTCGLALQQPWYQARSGTCGLYQLTQRNGRRCHAGLHLTAAADDARLHNLSLIVEAQAARIVMNAGRAVGVEIERLQGQREIVYATDQVILCAGAIGSPVLLMQSGIGEPDALQAQKIQCVHALPWVGKNLQDHLVCPLIFETRESTGLGRRHSPAERQLYRQCGTGGLASNIAEAGALFCTETASPASARPVEPTTTTAPAPDYQLHFTATHYLKYPHQPTHNHFCSLGVTDLHPQSRGEIRLERHARGWHPQIDPAYLRESVDSQRLLDALRWTRELASSEGLRELISHEVMPGIQRADERSMLKWVQSFAQSIYHPVGTCRIDCGAELGAERAVVDRDFRVHGIEGLRVIDASIFPSLPSCNTNAATLALAMKGAERILNG